jgi:hypothetical protein
MRKAVVFAMTKNRLFSTHRIRIGIGQQKLLSLILFACGFFAVQRFTITPINSFICVLPLGFFLIQMLRGKYEIALTCLVVALVLSIDNGGAVYEETVAPLRYFIYIFAIIMLFYLNKLQIQRQPLLLAVLLCGGITFGGLLSAFNNVPVDAATLQRDLLVLLILAAFLMVRGSVQLDLHLLYSGSLGYLVGEVVNVLFFHRDFIEYLSYDSLKVFVVFPLIYALSTRKNIITQVLLAIVTIYVIILYGSRMIALSMIMLFLLGSIIRSVRNGHKKRFLVFLIASFLFFNINILEILNENNLTQFKVISLIAVALQSLESPEFLETFALLDPIRFAEHQLFLSRPVLEIFFGSGLGVGIFDSNGFLGFVDYNQTAFSEKEIISSTYYNLHDFWIDFGLRFGMVPIIYLGFVLVLLPMWRGQIMQGTLFGLVMLNATFSTSGIILMALLVRLWPVEHLWSGVNSFKVVGDNP